MKDFMIKITTRWLCLLVIITSYSCRQSSSTLVEKDSIANHADELRKAILCSCLYEELNFSPSQRQKDGSLGMYVQRNSFSLESFDELQKILQKELRESKFESSVDASLSIGKCIEIVNNIIPPPAQ